MLARVTASLFLAMVLFAQPLRFEVASIKPTQEPGTFTLRSLDGLTANADLVLLTEMAFETRLIDWSHIPQNLRTQHFEINAKAAGPLTADQHWPLLRTLLLDRFKLAFHRESRDAQFMALVALKTQGPKLVPSPDTRCPTCSAGGFPGTITGQRVPLSRLARELSAFVERPVLDQTGLSGLFDFELTWTPEPGLSSPSAEGTKIAAAGVAISRSDASLFAALQEQLGLRLESKKGKIEFLVIDSVEAPSEN
jgi:uncharacterized protein (TIGR03435 family)